MRQPTLPGISRRPTRADIKSLVAHRLQDLLIRQRAREARRKRRKSGIQPPPSTQEALF